MNNIDAIAMAALLHDIGKFYQRTGAEIDDGNMHLCCKRNAEGYLTHHHALFTAKTIDRFQKQGWIKPFLKAEIFHEDDSFINVAAMHHNPQTKLQWIVAIADRISSGFERESFEAIYNSKVESPNYIESRLLSIFEIIGKSEKSKFDYRYPLRPFDELFEPQIANKVMPKNKEDAKKEYQILFNEFEESLSTIKENEDMARILDIVDSTLLYYTSAIPSATAMGTMPSISLYDHSKSTAAFATALAQYHENDDKPLNTKEAWAEKKFLLIQGDFFGIQQFIFSGSEENSKKVAKQLRGKSASISLMMELAALRIVEKLGLSRASIVQNMAGKFLIIAGNTKDNREKILEIEDEFYEWFLKKSYGEAGIILANITASCNEFSSKNLSSVLKKMAEEMELKKSQKFNLLTRKQVVFTEYLKLMKDSKPCRACAIHPIVEDEQCEMCNFFTYFGQKLASPKTKFIYIYRQNDQFDLFGYEIGFNYDPQKELIAKWDISLPDQDGYRFKGEAFRTLKAYIPFDEEKELPKEFSNLAELSKGQKALSVLKADVDNLGTLFIERLPKSGEMSFARYNMTARLINHFFTIKLAYLMQQSFKNTYTVFAGGDDLFVIGSWDEIQKFAVTLKRRFDKYFLVDISNMSFSAGILMVHDKIPVTFMARESEHALEQMKRDGKDGVRIFDNSVKFVDFIDLMELSEIIDHYKNSLNISTRFIYMLPHFARMQENIKKDISNTLWKSQLRYSGARNIIEKNVEKREKAVEFLDNIVKNIENYGKSFEVAVFTSLYKERERG